MKVLMIVPSFPKNMSVYEERYKETSKKDFLKVVENISSAIDLKFSEDLYEIVFITDRDPASEIIRYGLTNEADVIVKEAEDTENLHGLKAIDMELLRKSPFPVWLCRGQEMTSEQLKVAVAIDALSDEDKGGAFAKRLLELSHSLAHENGEHLNVLSCWDYKFEEFLRHNPWERMSEEEIQDEVNATQAEHKASLDNLVSQAALGDDKVHVTALRGAADEQIPNKVKALGVDLLVMGTVGRTGMSGFMIGNTAENMIRNLSCSLLALKPEGFVCPVSA